MPPPQDLGIYDVQSTGVRNITFDDLVEKGISAFEDYNLNVTANGCANFSYMVDVIKVHVIGRCKVLYTSM